MAAGLLLGGCSFTSRDVTLEPYAPSDGLQAELGDVLVRNVLVVSEGDGAPGVLSGAVVNRGDQEATVLVEVSGLLTEVDVAAGGTVFLGPYDEPDGELVVLDAVDAIAGGIVAVSFVAPADSATLEVPVLLPEGAYSDITPPADAGVGTGSSAEPTGEPDDDGGAEASAEPTVTVSADS